MESFQEFANNYPWFILVVILWSVTIKGVALWFAARRGQIVWFIGLIVVNTIGILEIIYLLGLRKNKSIFKGSRVSLYSPSL